MGLVSVYRLGNHWISATLMLSFLNDESSHMFAYIPSLRLCTIDIKHEILLSIKNKKTFFAIEWLNHQTKTFFEIEEKPKSTI